MATVKVRGCEAAVPCQCCCDGEQTGCCGVGSIDVLRWSGPGEGGLGWVLMRVCQQCTMPQDRRLGHC